MSVTTSTTTAREMQDSIVSMVKADDLAGALSLAMTGRDLYPTEKLAGGFTFGTLVDGLTAQLKPVNRPVSAAPVSAPAVKPVSAAPVSAPAARKTRKSAPAAKPVSAAPVSVAPVIPVSAPAAPVVGNVVTIEYHPQHGTISRGEVASEIFADLGWGYARKLGWHYLGDRGKTVAQSTETINRAMELLTAAGYDVRTSIKGDELPEAKPEAPATNRKRGTRQTFGAPVSAAPVSAPAAKPVSAAPAARKTRKSAPAAPVSAAPASDDALSAILAAIKAQGDAIAALQRGEVAAPAAPVSAAPVSAPAVAETETFDDDESAEDVLSRIMIEVAPKRARECAALAWRFVIRDGANARHTAEDLRKRLNAEVSGYYRDNRLGNVTFMVHRINAELTVTVKTVSGDVTPSKLRAQVQGIGLTTRGVDRAQSVKAER